MDFKHLALLFATLFLPACSGNNTNQNDVQKMQVETIEENSNTNPSKNITTKYTVDVLDDKEKIQSIEKEFNLGQTSLPINDNTPTLLSTFSTKVYTKTNARMNNLNIVCDKISDVIINPGEEFSYNDTAGPYDKEHGFGKATILMSDGSEVQGYGGGVCQVSSTLYNAVKDCGVEITERHNHSKDVYYVPKNQDATVSYGSLDFKFKNLNNYPIQIQASANKQNVTVEIYKI